MSLFIVRHAHALDAEDDASRPLSKRGRGEVRKIAAFLKRTGALQTKEVWHSSLLRSIETADLLVRQLGLHARLVKVANLEGEADPSLIAGRLRRRRQPLAIVGHEPHLSALVSLLVAGEAQPPRFELKKAAVVALDVVDGQWMVRWLISPEILGGVSEI